jgi:hypothetical protein
MMRELPADTCSIVLYPYFSSKLIALSTLDLAIMGFFRTTLDEYIQYHRRERRVMYHFL